MSKLLFGQKPKSTCGQGEDVLQGLCLIIRIVDRIDLGELWQSQH